MRKTTINVLMLSLFASQVLHIFGRLTVLRGPDYSYRRKLMCFSEDDGGALVWNTNLVWKYESYAFKDRQQNMKFTSLNGFNNAVDCAMRKNEHCLSLWLTKSWVFTNSLETPMGPALDQRWENFEELEYFDQKYHHVNLGNITAAKLSFSVRVLTDMHILLCDGEKYLRDFCYWIIIGGWGNMRSVIRKCPMGVPSSGNYPDNNSECSVTQTLLNHAPLSENEWRTFVITWDLTTRNISVYDTDNIIMTYTDTEKPKRLNDDYYMFVRSPAAMLLRFHVYDFLYTTTESATITSPIYGFSTKFLCIQLLIGLCAECDADVVLNDEINYGVLERITVKGSTVTTIYGLPMWQSVKIWKILPTFGYNKASIQIIPKANGYGSNPLWAVANVRQCRTSALLRQSSIHTHQDWVDRYTGYIWPNVTCQKLFYKQQSVVNSIPSATPNVVLDDTYCTREESIGPRCAISCTYLDSDAECKKTAICYEDGCTCPPGWIGSKCTQSCKTNTYGHGCEKKCGSCRDQICNKVTGECSHGCNSVYNNKIYIPPLCQIDIDKPDTPRITFVSKTSIKAVVPMVWKDGYENAEFIYYFAIKKQDERRYSNIYQSQSYKIYQNMTELKVTFKDLQYGTSYQIMCSLFVMQMSLSSEWQTVETDCDQMEKFEVTTEETALKINWHIDENQLYPCPETWYHLVVQTTGKEYNISITSFPYKLSNLMSYTAYNVTVFHTYDKVLFSRQVRTLESVPSKVVDLQSVLSSNTLTLSWKPPAIPNGEIERYEIILKIEEYYGCTELQKPTPDNRNTTVSTIYTTITIPELHLYAFYSVHVSAHNSRYAGKETKITFKTEQSETPVAIFSNLNVEGEKLSWSPPEDCTTVLGPIAAKIRIHGLGAVENFNETKKTYYYYLDLSKIKNMYGAERYLARVYVIRNYDRAENASAYRELEFVTPPKAPPEVNDLDVVESNIRTVHLRWQSPSPPLNGRLRAYGVVLCNKFNMHCQPIEVQLDEHCDLWDNYICKTVQSKFQAPRIHVEAYNVNVTEPGPRISVTQDMLNNKIPDPPGNCTFNLSDNSMVDLNWLHPWRTGGHLQYFQIQIEEISSYLRRRVSRSSTIVTQRHLVTNYTRNYNERLYLLPSTHYNVFIQAVTVEDQFSAREGVEIRTPSTTTFSGELKVTVHEADSTILLNIPNVENDTLNSMIHIVVIGPNPCEQHLELPANLLRQIDRMMEGVAWQVVEVMTNKLAGKEFTIGDSKTYGATNCPLKSGELYEIVVIVTEPNLSGYSIVLTNRVKARVGELVPTDHKKWLIPLLFLLAMAGVAFHFYRRRKQKSIKQLMLQDEVALSQNIENYEHDTKSMMSNLKQDLSTPSDRQSLSRATTPEVPPVGNESACEEKDMTSLVKVKDFEDYVRQAVETGSLDKRYETFPRGQTRPWDYGKLSQNKSKNRYGNLIAYDETRMILKKLPNDAHSDYINANYITGYKKEKRYIATQGPKPNTVIDFWRMIWQEKVLIICMLANVIENGKTKCEQYWPDIGKKKKYGDIIVLNAKHNVFADYCFRTLHITYEEEIRKIEHLHYTAWPDHGVPLYTQSVVTYLKKLLATPPGNGPVVVHCSAGVGRTGTIILCDICLHRAAAEGVIDVFAETASIRHERANMVDNKQQYLLAHLALVECLLSVPTTLPCNETLPTRIKELKKQLSVQQQRLQNTAWQDEALRQVVSPPSLSERNRAKNRFPELISDKVSRIYLKRYPASNEDSDYLSAVYVDGVRLQNQYLATQLPMPSTINDFWRMIAEFKVELILMLQPPDPRDPTCCSIAPASGEFKPTPYLNVTSKEIVELENYTSQKLVLVDNSEKPSREQSVTILCSTEWKPGRNQPPPPVVNMITFWQAAERIARGDGPTVALCHDGVTGCGLYLALSFLLERMAVERECDVCLAVRAVRRSRPDFVRPLEYMEYLYNAATTYWEYFETYANFS